MSKSLIKDTIRSIKRTKNRFFSIIAIVALGIGFFAGLKATAPDMRATANDYFLNNNLMDVRVLSNVGLSDEDVEAVRKLKGVEGVMPTKFVDGLIDVNGKPEIDMDGSAYSCRAYSLDMNLVQGHANGVNDIQYMNRPMLIEGEWPSKPNECLVDAALSAPESFKIGNTITLHGDGEDLNDSLNTTEYKIVGIIRTPYYLSFEHGNTLIGSGKLCGFMYIPSDNFKLDYYPEMYLKVDGTTDVDFDSFDNDQYEKIVNPIIKEIEKISADRAPLRAEMLRADYTSKLAQAKIDYENGRMDAERQLAEARQQLDIAKEFAKTGDAEIARMQAELEATFNDAQREIYSGQYDHSAGMQQYAMKLDAYNSAVAQMAMVNEQFEKAETEMAINKDKLTAAKYAIDKSDKEIKDAEKQIESAQDGIDKLKDQLDKLDNSQNENIIAIKKALEEELKAAEEKLEEGEEELRKGKRDLEKAKNEYNTELRKYNDALAKFNLFKAEKKKKESQLYAANQELNAAKEALTAAGSDLKFGQLILSAKQQEARYQLEQARQKLAQAKQAAKTGEAEYAKKEAEVEDTLKLAESRIKSSERKLANLDSPKWYAFDRNDTPGFTGYGQTADRMQSLSRVFPLFFFLVAAMISLTTMTRMVEEERVQIGTLKALGYDNKAIVSKYLIYASLASIAGSVIGLIIGYTVLPIAICAAWDIMYDLPQVSLHFYWGYSLIGILIAVLSTVAAAYIACRKELTIQPAQLMRPKTPKAGKRIFLEKIPFIWGKLGFTSKVTARNIFRNKKRFFTTVIGIGGCTALLVAGFGLNDSINAINKNQFEDGGIFRYDGQLILSDPVINDGSYEAPIITTLKDNDKIESAMLTDMKVLHAGDVNNEDSQLEANILVPQSTKDVEYFVDLHNRKSKDKIHITDKGVIVTEKLAETANAGVGDEIRIYNTDGTSVKAKIAGIAENYTFHFIYMSQSQYKELFHEDPQFNSVMFTLGEKIKADAAKGGQQKGQLAAELMKMDEVNACIYTTQTADTLDKAIESLTLVVIVFIVSAAALAFVVLYNLSNININERIRELATIKVLGFYDQEVSEYIYRENIFLTIIGIALGLFMGIFLHRLVANAIQVDIVMFGKTISALSYFLSALLTAFFSVIVNLMMHFRMKKISMVESLKSVE